MLIKHSYVTKCRISTLSFAINQKYIKVFYIDKKEKHIQFIYQLQIPLHYHNKKTIIWLYIGIKQITLAAVKFTNLHKNVNDDYQENYHDDSKVNVIFQHFFLIFKICIFRIIFYL